MRYKMCFYQILTFLVFLLMGISYTKASEPYNSVLCEEKKINSTDVEAPEIVNPFEVYAAFQYYDLKTIQEYQKKKN